MNERKSNRFAGKRTICEVHRQIYDLLVVTLSDDDAYKQLLHDVDVLLTEAFNMGVSLCKALIDYKLKLPNWERNNKAGARKLRELRKEIMESKLKDGLEK